jgi:hypothetical protein
VRDHRDAPNKPENWEKIFHKLSTHRKKKNCVSLPHTLAYAMNKSRREVKVKNARSITPTEALIVLTLSPSAPHATYKIRQLFTPP